MENNNYSQLYKKITRGLSERTKKIIDLRFGIEEKKGGQTLESIGEKFNITRERVRQIIEKAFSEIREKHKRELDEIFNKFSDYFKKEGGFKREEKILSDLGKDNYQPYVLFFLNLGKPFKRICEKNDFYSFWTTKEQPLEKVRKIGSLLKKELGKIGKPQQKEDFVEKMASKHALKKEHLLSFLEISKNIKENKDGKVGLVGWPEISPKGVKDKSFLVLQKEKKPLHFREVARLIDVHGYNPGKKTFPQTVHNELIKDPRFVLVGRGTYALREWGYVPGTVKDVISEVLKRSKKPLTKEEIVEKVLSQRLVAKNTVLMNLSNNEEFVKNPKERYTLKDIQTA